MHILCVSRAAILTSRRPRENMTIINESQILHGFPNREES